MIKSRIKNLTEGTRVRYAQPEDDKATYVNGTVVRWRNHDRVTTAGGLYPPNAMEPDGLCVQWDPAQIGELSHGPFVSEGLLVALREQPDVRQPFASADGFKSQLPCTAGQYRWFNGGASTRFRPGDRVRVKSRTDLRESRGTVVTYHGSAAAVSRAVQGGLTVNWEVSAHLSPFIYADELIELIPQAIPVIPVTPVAERSAKKVIYVAHPVSGDPVGNASKTVAWIRYLTKADPTRIYVAPWVAEVLAFAAEQGDKAFYDRVLEDDCDVVRRLDGVLMVGGKVSEGMRRERDAAVAAGKTVVDMADFTKPPGSMAQMVDLRFRRALESFK